MIKKGSLLGGILLVSGTTVGVGMLALPVVTSFSGFFPSIGLLVMVWFLMTFTAFLLLEVNLWMKEEVNLLSMAEITLGKRAAFLCGVVYLFLLYCLTTAYLSTSAAALSDACQKAFDVDLPIWISSVPYLVVFGMFVYLGTQYADLFNRLLMAGLVVSYMILITSLPQHVKIEHLSFVNWKGSLVAISYIVLSFGFHIIIPTLVTYFDRNIPLLKKALFWGSLVPLFVYIIWEYLVLGTLPLTGDDGLFSIWVEKKRIISSLENVTRSPQVALGARWFEFFAVLTSFIGVSLSLVDFLADIIHVLLKVKSKSSTLGKMVLCLLTFVPPYLFSIFNPKIFYQALNLAGVFGVVILLMIYPVFMVWSGRYKMNQVSEFKVWGGKPALVGILVFSSLVILLYAFEHIGGLSKIAHELINA
jgi:tyrosine-specific transport protein